MKNKKCDLIIIMLLAVITLIIIIATFMIASDCYESGGKVVRGLIWFECIGVKGE